MTDLEAIAIRCFDRRLTINAATTPSDEIPGLLDAEADDFRQMARRRAPSISALQAQVRALQLGTWVRHAMTDSPDEATRELLLAILDGVEQLSAEQATPRATN